MSSRFIQKRLALGVLACFFLSCVAEEKGVGVGLLDPAELAPRIVAPEVSLEPDGRLMPVFLTRADELQLCLTADSRLDTGQWHLDWDFEGDGFGSSRWPLTRSLGSTVCFDGKLPEHLPLDENLEICPRLADTFDDSQLDLPCSRIRISDRLQEQKALRGRLSKVLSSTEIVDLDGRIEAIDRLADEAQEAGFSILDVRFRLVGVYFLRRDDSAESQARAGRRLESLPEWIELPEAASLFADVLNERALFHLYNLQDLAGATTLLRRAEETFRSVAQNRWLAAVTLRATILTRVGLHREGHGILLSALDDCRATFCTPAAISYAQGQLGWFVLQDLDANREELLSGREELRRAVDHLSHQDGVEVANHWVNLAHLDLRLGKDPHPALEQAFRELGSETGSGDRRRLIADWAELVEALDVLQNGDPGRAKERCLDLGERGNRPVLITRAFSCAGEAARLSGDFEEALELIRQSLVYHELSGSEALTNGFAADFGQRADDYYSAARLEVELGRPAAAWRWLESLDDRSLAERRHCAAGAETSEVLERRKENRRSREAVLQRLESLPRVGEGTRKLHLQSRRRALEDELRRLIRTQEPSCSADGSPEPGFQARYRAFATVDEIVVLERARDGSVTTARRSPLDRGALIERLKEILAAQESRILPDAEWRRLTRPISEALWVEAFDRGESVVDFALHGVLQHVPLSALPSPTEPERWLADATTVVLVPVGAGTGPRPSAEGSRTPLFVVDPQRNLPSGEALAARYAERFPSARILHADRATRDAFLREIALASRLHVDAHGEYEPGFPELSKLWLADGPVTLIELLDRDVPTELANLSGCQTGRWPTTADSGRYGLAGLFARQGTAWVIGSRTDLDDKTAALLNGGLYDRLRGGDAVLEAYTGALEQVREARPAAEWSSILLFRGRPIASD